MPATEEVIKAVPENEANKTRYTVKIKFISPGIKSNQRRLIQISQLFFLKSDKPAASVATKIMECHDKVKELLDENIYYLRSF